MKNKRAVIEITVGTIVTIVLIMAVLVILLILTKTIFVNEESTIVITQDVCHTEYDLARCDINSTACYKYHDYTFGGNFDLKFLETKKIKKQFSMAGLESLNKDYIKDYVLRETSIGDEPTCGWDLRYYYYDNYGSCFITAVIDVIARYHTSVENSSLIFKTILVENITGKDIRFDGDIVKNLRYDKNDIMIDIIVNRYTLVRNDRTVCSSQEVDKVSVIKVDCSYLEQKEQELKDRIDKFGKECVNFDNLTIQVDNKFQIRDEVYRCILLRQELYDESLLFSKEKDDCYRDAFKYNYEMPKENITIEWLDNTCEKLSSCICHKTDGCDFEEIAPENCVQYKCDKYTVGVYTK